MVQTGTNWYILVHTGTNQYVTYNKSYDASLRHHDEKLDAPWKAHGVSHTSWRPLSASRTHPRASTTIVTAVLDGGLAGFKSNRQRTALRMRSPGQPILRVTPGRRKFD